MQPQSPFDDALAYAASDDENELELVDENNAPAPEILPESPEWPVFKRAAELVKRKYQMARELKALNKELGQLQPIVISYLEQRTLWDGVVIDGFRLYTQHQLWARVKPNQMPNACAAMRATGLSRFVHDTFNVNQFSAHVRELKEQNQERLESGELSDISLLLPSAVVATLNITTDATLKGVQRRKK